MIFVVTLVGSIVILAMDTKASLVEENTNFHYSLERDVMCRDHWGTLWYFYTNGSYALYSEKSLDNGTTWGNKTLILAGGWEGTIYLHPADVVVTDNNSIVLSIRTKNYSNPNFEQMLLVKYNETDTWFEVMVFTSGTDSYGGQIAINRTNHILICYRYSGFGLTRIYDFDANTLGAQGTFISLTGVDQFPTVNMSNDFWIAYYTPSVPQPGYCRDYNKTLAEESFGTYAYITAFACLENDVLVVMSIYHYGSVESVGYYYRTGLATWIYRGLSATGHSDWYYYNGAMSINDENQLCFIAMIDASKILCRWGPFEYTTATLTWQASETALFYGSGQTLPLSHFGDLYPVRDGNRLDVLDTGWCFAFYSQDGTYDNYFNGTATFDNPWLGYVAPEEPEPETEPEDNGVSEFIDIPCFISGLIILVIGIFLISLIIMGLDAAS